MLNAIIKIKDALGIWEDCNGAIEALIYDYFKVKPLSNDPTFYPTFH